MRDLAKIAIEAGLVDGDALAEFKRWGHPDLAVGEMPAMKPEKFNTMAKVISALDEALVSHGQVLVQETDLDIVRTYLQTQEQGMLHVETDTQMTELPVSYGVTKLGDYILPYKGEAIEDLLANGLSFLALKDGFVVYFTDVRPVSLGEMKSFLIGIVGKTAPRAVNLLPTEFQPVSEPEE